MTNIDFAKHLHQPFQLQFSSLLTLWLKLEMVQQPSTPVFDGEHPQDKQSLSLIFQGPRQPVLPARTYQLSHTILGDFDLLLTPHKRGQTGIQYEAVLTL